MLNGASVIISIAFIEMSQCRHQSQKEPGGLLAVPRSTAGGCSSPPGACSSPPAPSQHPSQRRC